jgi:hypothetical protein
VVDLDLVLSEYSLHYQDSKGGMVWRKCTIWGVRLDFCTSTVIRATLNESRYSKTYARRHAAGADPRGAGNRVTAHR